MAPTIDEYRAWADEDERFYQDLEARRADLPQDIRPVESRLLLDARSHVLGRFYEAAEVAEEAVSALNDFERGLAWLSENVTEAEEVHYGRSVPAFEPPVRVTSAPEGRPEEGGKPSLPPTGSKAWWVFLALAGAIGFATGLSDE